MWILSFILTHGALGKRKGKLITSSSWCNSAFFNTRNAQLKTSTFKSTHFFFVSTSLFLRDEDVKSYRGIQHFLPNSSFRLLDLFANLFLSWFNQISWWSIRSLSPSSSCLMPALPECCKESTVVYLVMVNSFTSLDFFDHSLLINLDLSLDLVF